MNCPQNSLKILKIKKKRDKFKFSKNNFNFSLTHWKNLHASSLTHLKNENILESGLAVQINHFVSSLRMHIIHTIAGWYDPPLNVTSDNYHTEVLRSRRIKGDENIKKLDRHELAPKVKVSENVENHQLFLKIILINFSPFYLFFKLNFSEFHFYLKIFFFTE